LFVTGDGVISQRFDRGGLGRAILSRKEQH
jgi:hypothetical protein